MLELRHGKSGWDEVLRQLRGGASQQMSALRIGKSSRLQILRRMRRGADAGSRSQRERQTFCVGRGTIGTGAIRRGRRERARRRAQDRDRAVRRHQGLDGPDGRTRSRRGARNCRSGAEADDRRRASLRRLHRAIDRRWSLRVVRRSGRARRPCPARTLCGAARAGGDEKVFGRPARGGKSAGRSPGRTQHRRGGGALDSNRRRAYRVHADRALDESGGANADACTDRVDRHHGADPKTHGRLLRLETARPGANQGRQRTGQRVRGDWDRPAQDTASDVGVARAVKVRGPARGA